MANNQTMDQQFETKKNMQAGAITLVICTCIFLLFFFVQWRLPEIQKPIVEDVIEVNLGNSDVGSGTEQPLVPGEPAPTASENNTPPAPSNTEASNTNSSNEPNDPEGAAVSKNPKPEVKATSPTPVKTNTKNTMSPTTERKPKVVMGKYAGGKGPGGNNADSYNKSTSEGNDPNGNGDKGQMNGSPTGKSYTGPTVIRGNRRFVGKLPSSNTDVPPGTVVAEINVSPDGVGTFVGIDLRSSSSNSAAYKNEIIRYLKTVRFDKSTTESLIAVKFIFK